MCPQLLIVSQRALSSSILYGSNSGHIKWISCSSLGVKRPLNYSEVGHIFSLTDQKLQRNTLMKGYMPMARIEKYNTGIVGVIKHNIREFKDGKCPTNMEVDPERSNENYSIIRRGETAKDIEKYRKKIEKECFHYNRKNLVHANEVVCSLPADCPPEQEHQFFEESYKYICSTIPMGERAVFLAEVHGDEGRVLKDGVTVVEGAKHLHVMYVPAVKDSKHDGYDYRLCSDELTKRAVLKQWHPKYQKWMDDAGVSCTVASGVTSGKGISVKSLKEITKETGLSLEQIKDLEKQNNQLYEKLMEKEHKLAASHQTITKKDSIITELRDYATTRDKAVENLTDKVKSISADKEKADLQTKLQEKEIENQKLKSDAQRIISEKDMQLEKANERLAEKDRALAQAQDRIKELETKQKNVEVERPEPERTWGDNSWGNNSGWGNADKPKTYDEEKLW